MESIQLFLANEIFAKTKITNSLGILNVLFQIADQKFKINFLPKKIFPRKT